MDRKRIRLVIISSALLFLIPIVAFVVNTINNGIYSAKLELVVAPLDAEVLINDEVGQPGIVRLKPGSYTIKVQKQGFDTQITKVELSEKDEKVLYFALFPNDDNTMDWYKNHTEDALVLGAFSVYLHGESEELVRQNEIASKLSIDNSMYKLGYSEYCEGESEFCIVIDARFGVRSTAIKRLTQIDNGIGKYKIKYLNYSSPFYYEQIAIPSDLSYELRQNELRLDNEVINDIIRAAEYWKTKMVQPEMDKMEVLSIKPLNDNLVGVTLKMMQSEKGDKIYDVYRIVLGRNNNGWISLSNPTLLMTYQENLGLPHELIDAVNQL